MIPYTNLLAQFTTRRYPRPRIVVRKLGEEGSGSIFWRSRWNQLLDPRVVNLINVALSPDMGDDLIFVDDLCSRF